MAVQKSQKGANGIVMKRKIYQKFLDWKEKRNGEVALLVEGARRIGKSYIVEEFAKNEYESYILIDFNKAPQMVRDWFDLYMEDLDTLFLYLSQHYKVRLHERKSLIILDEVQLCPRARAAIKFLVADRRYDYIETGSLVSIKKNMQGIVLPSEERPIQMYPMDFEEFLWATGNDMLMDFIRKMYVKLTETPEYQEYMTNGKDSFSDDKHFLVTVIDTYMAENGLLYDYYSDRDLSFTSDYQLAIYLLWKYVSEMSSGFNADTKLPQIYTDDEDKEFVVKLFDKTILHVDEYRELVNDNISNWDYDRLALMDKIIIFMALTEFCEFHFIPVKVTINEYIEISKYFSTPESRRFVNGMLDALSTKLKENGKLVKTGIGLIDK